MSKQNVGFEGTSQLFFSKSANIWSMMQIKNNKIGHFNKNRVIKKLEAAIIMICYRIL